MNRAYLFVYGTLRKDYGLKLMEDLSAICIFAGHGTVKGALYEVGSYPAAVESVGTKGIKGDVYEVSDAEIVFDKLDEYEGDAYCRKKTTVVMDSGEVREAFVYWYTGTTDRALLIEESDYLDYLKNKKDRFL
jgi:gamma-glutamylcyclotransferase (GGCT)/AIG2-like uncharacterized protein YtfP